jgi:ATP/maltotriose-dependent transcriptional regulator MalT
MAVRIAKLSPPRATRIHPRASLFRRLDEAARRRAVWVTGPPGSGKTALATSWSARSKGRVLWYQLDAGDGDPGTFFHFVSLAASQVANGSALPRFSTESLEAPHLFARRYFRELGQATAQRLLLILDDYHEIGPDSPMHQALAHGFQELPEHLLALVLSRADPPPAFARMRASELLEVVDGDALTLSLAEARAVAQVRRVGPAVVRRVPELHARSGGWAAGFVLLLAGADGDAAPAGIHLGRSSLRAIADYFDQEVLATADAQARRTLLACSLPRGVTAAGAVRLTGHAEAPAVLEDLARRSYFTTRGETSPPTYKFHDLFRSFLRQRAAAELPEGELNSLRSDAARVLAGEGRMEEALDLALEAGDFAQARDLFLALAPAILHEGRLGAGLEWAARLPEDQLAADRELLYWVGILRFPTSPAAALGMLERAFELSRRAADTRGVWLCWASLVESHAWGLGDARPLDQWLAMLDALTGEFPFPDEEVRVRVIAAVIAGMAERQPSNPAFREWLDQALDLALADVPVPFRVQLGIPLLNYYGWWASGTARGGIISDALQQAVQGAGANPVLTLLWEAFAATMHVHTGQMAKARETAERGLARAKETGLRRWDPLLHMARALTEIIAGDHAATDAVLRDLGEATRDVPPLHRCVFHQMSGIAALVRGQLSAALDHGTAALHCATGTRFAEGACQLTVALATSRMRSEGDIDALRRTLEFCREHAYGQGEAMAALALASEALRVGDLATALDGLREGLAVARRIGHRTHQWLRASEYGELCALALEHGVEPDLVLEIIDACGFAPEGSARFLDSWPRRLKITALGGLSIERDGQPLGAGARAHRRTRELLGLLVAHGPRGARAEALCDALWPESEGDAARSALDTLAWRLRKLLGEPEAVLHREGRFLLNTAKVFVDAWALESLADAAAQGAPAGRVPRDLLLRRAALLAKGELLPGEGEPAVVAAREQLRSKLERLRAESRG